jgi:hypothetical protein
MVTHSSTSRPVQCLCMAERTGCPVLTDLWSYVIIKVGKHFIKLVNLEDLAVSRASVAYISSTIRLEAKAVLTEGGVRVHDPFTWHHMSTLVSHTAHASCLD